MSDKLFEDLAKKHPDLMQKSRIGEYLGVGAGWFTIIDVLCQLISQRVSNLRGRLRYSLEKDDGKAAELEKQLAEAIEELPIIAQVKEKFGGLRFYVDNASPEIYSYIEFAESMSYHICEECGDDGHSRQGSWIKVRCDKHQAEHEAQQRAVPKLQRRPGPKLSDEVSEE